MVLVFKVPFIILFCLLNTSKGILVIFAIRYDLYYAYFLLNR